MYINIYVLMYCDINVCINTYTSYSMIIRAIHYNIGAEVSELMTMQLILIHVWKGPLDFGRKAIPIWPDMNFVNCCS